MIIRILFSATLAALITACAPMQSSAPIQKVTSSGTEVELANWAYWNNACEGEAFETRIISPPTSGQVEQRPGIFAIPARTSSGNLTGCVDKIVESVQVFYIPNTGFTGTDAITVEFSGSSGVVRNAYSVRVQ